MEEPEEEKKIAFIICRPEKMMITTTIKRAIGSSKHFPCFYRISSSGKHDLAVAEPSHSTNRIQSIKIDDNIHEISNAIIEKLNHVSKTPPTSHIFKVHHQLRVVNEKAYEPVMLSIGPYHRGKSNLQRMEEHKLRYLNQLIERREGKGVARSHQLNTYIRTLKDMEDQARGYYDQVIAPEPSKFLEMMLLDGCFIIELFREFSRDEKERDPFLKTDWIHNALARDLTLLENQLPFFVLKSLHQKIDDEPGDLLHLVFTALNYLPTYSHLPPCQNNLEKRIARQSISDLAKRPLLPSSNPGKRRCLDPEKLNDIKHLLDLVRKFMLVEETLEVKCRTKQGAYQEKGVLGSDGKVKRTNKFRFSAVELRNSGVTFKRVEKGKFYDIRFRKGVLEIPVVRVTDNTEALFRNLIAYEEHDPSNNGVKHISHYMGFMDGLINSRQDIELLRQKGIIENLMGDDEAVSAMFNRMNKNTVIAQDFHYEEVICSLTKYCEKSWNHSKAKLRKNYLDCPWAFLSILVGSLLLLMEIAQTVISVLSYYKTD